MPTGKEKSTEPTLDALRVNLFNLRSSLEVATVLL